ncbi:AraC family transcriptional regulator [Sorangium sp. So ce118]
MHDRSSDEKALSPDALSEVLQDLRLSEGTYGRCELKRPWGIDLPPVAQARFHFVVSGVCWLRAPKRGWLELHAGDVALLPHGTGHAIADRARGRVKPLEEMPLEEIGDRTYEMRAGGAGARSILVCCSVGFAQPSVNPLLELMPPLLLVRGGGAEDAVLPVLLDAMADEVLRRRVGAATVMTRLADVVITRVVRAWVESRTEDTEGWLAAIRDPQIGRALAAIHRRPGEPWSVESLADVARMSRSIFSERFAAVVGVPPARYLARWRMHVASGWLRDDRVTVAEAAVRLGYDSEAAFSRAFKRFSGVPPSALRRQDRDERPRAARAADP